MLCIFERVGRVAALLVLVMGRIAALLVLVGSRCVVTMFIVRKKGTHFRHLLSVMV